VSYFYRAQTDAEIERIATAVLARFPSRRLGSAVDIEGILEDLGMELLPRRGFRQHAEGYLANDPRIIVVDEAIFSYMPRARFTIAEEVSHLILEYRLWTGGKLPAGARSHELTEEQHFFVEKDARSLASALLMPRVAYTETFSARQREMTSTGAPAITIVREALRHTAEVFQVSPRAAAQRALKLKLISRDELRRLFPES